MALMSLRSRTHVKECMVLTRANNLFIHNYISSKNWKIKLAKMYSIYKYMNHI